MDCKTALEILELGQAREPGASDPDLAGASAHVESCPHCLIQMDTRRAFDSEVSRAMRSVAVPADLRDRIHLQLERRGSSRRIIRRVFWPVSAALAASLIIGATLYFRPAARPQPLELATERLGDLVILDPSSIEDLRVATTIFNDVAAVRAWSSKQAGALKLSADIPQFWPAEALTGVGRTSILGRRIALFRYQDDRGESDVLAFPHAEFQITHLRKGFQVVAHTRNLVAIAWSERDTTYVAVLKGWSSDDWEPMTRQAVDLT